MKPQFDDILDELEGGVRENRMRALLIPLGAQLGDLAPPPSFGDLVCIARMLGIVWDPRACVFVLPKDMVNYVWFRVFVAKYGDLTP